MASVGPGVVRARRYRHYSSRWPARAYGLWYTIRPLPDRSAELDHRRPTCYGSAVIWGTPTWSRTAGIIGQVTVEEHLFYGGMTCLPTALRFRSGMLEGRSEKADSTRRQQR